jgi:hypothetical protein
MTTSREGHEFSPEPSLVLRYFLRWLRGFHLDRERSKAADWAMVVLTVFAVVAAFGSAWLFELQLFDARRSTDATIHNFMVDERAWVELEAIKGTLLSAGSAKIGAGFTYPIYVHNVGKTVARDVKLRASRNGSQSSISMGDNADSLARIQDKLLLGKIPSAADIPITIATPTVLAPNSTSPVPAILIGQEPRYYTNDEWVSYIIGRIDYADEFGIPHWLKFCFFVADAKGNLGNCKVGNDEDRNAERTEESHPSNRDTFLRNAVISLLTGVGASVAASFVYAGMVFWNRERRLRRDFSPLAGEYREAVRHTEPTPTGGKVRLTYCGGTKLRTEALTQTGAMLWQGEIFMREEAGVLGAGYYSYKDQDDTGTHQVIYNPSLKQFNVSGQNTSKENGRTFKMVWQRVSNA